GLKAALGHVHVEEEVDAVRFGPGDVVIDPVPTGLLVDPGRRVVFEGQVVEQEARGVRAHRLYAAEVDLTVIVRHRAVGPHFVTEGGAAEEDLVALAVHDGCSLYFEKAAGSSRRDASSARPHGRTARSCHRSTRCAAGLLGATP